LTIGADSVCIQTSPILTILALSHLLMQCPYHQHASNHYNLYPSTNKMAPRARRSNSPEEFPFLKNLGLMAVKTKGDGK